jgi:hypothetical protein
LLAVEHFNFFVPFVISVFAANIGIIPHNGIRKN